MGSIGPSELILIFLVVLLLFGSKRLPELARGLGKGIREFKKAANEIRDELDVSSEIKTVKREIEGEIKKDYQEPKKEISGSKGE
ncbi:MAG: twin-arginine translocase TatA/TatE family subunit [Calditrichaeota bacterium]|nr:MAG: twin-arginine translocase TatA/TatE family subunit [Calditrichota bacterium]